MAIQEKVACGPPFDFMKNNQILRLHAYGVTLRMTRLNFSHKEADTII